MTSSKTTPEYWSKFYKKQRIDTPTNFVKWAVKFIPKDSVVVDVGCGNGRDTYYLAERFETTGVDFAYSPMNDGDAKFMKLDFRRVPPCFDVCYSRFFLHTLSWNEIRRFIGSVRGTLIAEFRVEGDKPKIYPKHYRNFINLDNLIQLLLSFNFEIIHAEKGRGLAKFKNEDPLVGRMVARRK